MWNPSFVKYFEAISKKSEKIINDLNEEKNSLINQNFSLTEMNLNFKKKYEDFQ
jgi:hypothetical protein